jgi:hypothetical protein
MAKYIVSFNRDIVFSAVIEVDAESDEQAHAVTEQMLKDGKFGFAQLMNTEATPLLEDYAWTEEGEYLTYHHITRED